MEFTYVGSGLLNIHGCPEVDVEIYHFYKYAVGSKVYDRLSALAGYLEAVIIREAWFVCNAKIGKRTMYKDSNNWLHNEYDLCSQTEAIDILTNYYEGKQQVVDSLLAELNC